MKILILIFPNTSFSTEKLFKGDDDNFICKIAHILLGIGGKALLGFFQAYALIGVMCGLIAYSLAQAAGASKTVSLLIGLGVGLLSTGIALVLGSAVGWGAIGAITLVGTALLICIAVFAVGALILFVAYLIWKSGG
jgi:hypothetical protein